MYSLLLRLLVSIFTNEPMHWPKGSIDLSIHPSTRDQTPEITRQWRIWRDDKLLQHPLNWIVEWELYWGNRKRSWRTRTTFYHSNVNRFDIPEIPQHTWIYSGPVFEFYCSVNGKGSGRVSVPKCDPLNDLKWSFQVRKIIISRTCTPDPLSVVCPIHLS